MPSHADFKDAVPDVIGRLGYWPYGDPEPVTGGSLNWNFGIESDGGRLFVRRHRDDVSAARIRAEHRLVGWLAERGIPAPVPFKTETDETVLSIAGGNWSVFPWVDGVVGERGGLSGRQLETLGAVHGATQAVLATHPDSAHAELSMRWDKGESAALLDRILAVARQESADSWMLAAVERQQEMLDALDVRPPADFAGLPCQLLHGDFHDHQVIWSGEDVVAIVDWELFGPNPRIWELIRSLAFSKLLGTAGMTPYIIGYRRFVQLDEDECRLGLQLWWQSRVVGVWAWAAHFLDGNERVRSFLPEVAAELARVADAAWKLKVEAQLIEAACG